MIVKRNVFLVFILGIIFFISGCSGQSENSKDAKQNVLSVSNSSVNVNIIPLKSKVVGQIHGIGYPGNDNALYVATNQGLKLYRDSKWLETTANQHNYMSFQAVALGFLASGHPEKNAVLKDPLGIIESVDQGKSLKNIAFYGEGNFHFLSASFFGNGLYMINEKPEGGLAQGVYYSTNNGKSWNKSNFNHFTADSLGMIAVHAKKGNIMAMATKTGIYYSENYGNTMQAITGPIMVTAITFAGDDLIYSSVENKQILLKKLNPKTGEQTSIIFPFLDYNNPVTYIAVEPKNENKLAFATYKNDLFESKDGGKSWSSIVSNGSMEQN